MRIVLLMLLALAVGTVEAAAQTIAEQRAIMARFIEAIDQYAAKTECVDGHYFTLPVAMVFRQVIARTGSAGSAGSVGSVGSAGSVGSGVPAMDAPGPRQAVRVEVCQPLPLGDSRVPPAVMTTALPTLPAELEYRLVGNDLVIRDVRRNLVVAVLREAIGTHVTTL